MGSNKKRPKVVNAVLVIILILFIYVFDKTNTISTRTDHSISMSATSEHNEIIPIEIISSKEELPNSPATELPIKPFPTNYKVEDIQTTIPATSVLPSLNQEDTNILPDVIQTLYLSDEKLLASAKCVYYSVYFFENDSLSSSMNSEPTPSASVIKIFIMDFIYNMTAKGELSLENTVHGQSIQSLVKAMIQYSDNDATNILIDEFGMETLNEYFSFEGYNDTLLKRRMLDYNALAQGLDNYTSLDDTMNFLKTLYKKRDVFPYSEMLEILEGQTIRTKIPAFLPEGTVVANKTGEINSIQNDVGIVFSENGDFAIVVLTNECINASHTANVIADFALQAFEFGLQNEQ